MNKTFISYDDIFDRSVKGALWGKLLPYRKLLFEIANEYASQFKEEKLSDKELEALAEKVYEKHTGSNEELQYKPTPKENIISAMLDFHKQASLPTGSDAVEFIEWATTYYVMNRTVYVPIDQVKELLKQQRENCAQSYLECGAASWNDGAHEEAILESPEPEIKPITLPTEKEVEEMAVKIYPPVYDFSDLSEGTADRNAYDRKKWTEGFIAALQYKGEDFVSQGSEPQGFGIGDAPLTDISTDEQTKLQEDIATKWLLRIANPLKYLQEEAEKEGARLNGNAAILCKDGSWLQELAQRGLREIDILNSDTTDETSVATEAK
jgi:hypothetical protein